MAIARLRCPLLRSGASPDPLYGTALQEEEYRAPPAHYFGVPAVGVTDAETLEQALRTALAATGPTVIEAVVDSEHYVDTVYD